MHASSTSLPDLSRLARTAPTGVIMTGEDMFAIFGMRRRHGKAFWLAPSEWTPEQLAQFEQMEAKWTERQDQLERLDEEIRENEAEAERLREQAAQQTVWLRGLSEEQLTQVMRGQDNVDEAGFAMILRRLGSEHLASVLARMLFARAKQMDERGEPPVPLPPL